MHLKRRDNTVMVTHCHNPKKRTTLLSHTASQHELDIRCAGSSGVVSRKRSSPTAMGRRTNSLGPRPECRFARRFKDSALDVLAIRMDSCDCILFPLFLCTFSIEEQIQAGERCGSGNGCWGRCAKIQSSRVISPLNAFPFSIVCA